MDVNEDDEIVDAGMTNVADLETGGRGTSATDTNVPSGNLVGDESGPTTNANPGGGGKEAEDQLEPTADAMQDISDNNEEGRDLITTNAVVLVVDEEQPGTAPSSGGLDIDIDAAAAAAATATTSAPGSTAIQGGATALVVDHGPDDHPLAASDHGNPAAAAAAGVMAALPPTARAEFVSVTVIKKTPEDRLGIAFATAGGIGSGAGSGGNDTDEENINNPAPHDMRILSLNEDGMLHGSPLRVGDQLLSIAGKSCFELDTPTAGALLRQARGIVSIVVRNPTGRANFVETMVEKAEPTSPVGLAFRRNSFGSLEVSKVIATGLFAHSLLNVGDRVISINNVPCRQGLSAQEAVDMIRATPRFVTILTETHAASGVVVASAEHGEELAFAAAVEASTQLAAATAAAQHKHETSLLHSCYCIWMIIISMSLIGLAVFQPFKRFRGD